MTGSIVLRRGNVPTALIDRLHNPRRDRFIVLAAGSIALLASVGGLLGGRTPSASLQPAAKVSAALSAMGLQNPGVVDASFSAPGLDVHRIIASGYLPTNADGSPRVENAQDRILAAVRRDMPLGGVDAIVITLRTGVNVGVYSRYASTNRVEPAVAGGTVR
jgi:hypothetical protein